MSKTRKGRKGPTDSATKFQVGTKKKGNDGNTWKVVKTSNGVQRWKKHSDGKGTRKKDKTLKGKTYFTHSNGSRPFMAVIHKNDIHVHKLPKDVEDKHKYTKEDYTVSVHTFKGVHKSYVGNSVKGDDANGNKTFGKGNSILLHCSGKKYAFVGSSVFEFELEKDDEFEHFFSAIGPSDIPYPILLGKKNVYFLLLEGRSIYYLPRDLDEFNNFPTKHNWALRAYDVFYGDTSFNETFSPKYIKKKYKKVKGLKIIHEYLF